jgi:hypothetical protein
MRSRSSRPWKADKVAAFLKFRGRPILITPANEQVQLEPMSGEM